MCPYYHSVEYSGIIDFDQDKGKYQLIDRLQLASNRLCVLSRVHSSCPGHSSSTYVHAYIRTYVHA